MTTEPHTIKPVRTIRYYVTETVVLDAGKLGRFWGPIWIRDRVNKIKNESVENQSRFTRLTFDGCSPLLGDTHAKRQLN